MSTTYKNDILPFGTSGRVENGDVLTLDQYAADPQRLVGHQPGIARQALENTVLRQVSHMAAGLAQYIANRYPGGVRDDGDLGAVENGLLSALASGLQWHATADYAPPALVVADDGDLYLCLVPSGPRTTSGGKTVGAKDPKADTDFWVRLPNMRDVLETPLATAKAAGHVKPGTGLEVDAAGTVAVKYGAAESTACQGNDARLSNARTPTAHKSTHKTGGADALAPTDIGAAAASITITAGTGLSGGGNLTANRSLAVTYGTTAGTACQGNDARLADTRNPKAHKANHAKGGADALTPADIGAAANTITISAGTGLSGGGNLTANRSLAVKYGAAAGTACQGNDSRLTSGDAYRLSRIGCPHWLSTTTLPAGYMWADGSLALFADWPEFSAAYKAGRFAGMTLAATASAADKAAYPGKFILDAANPTGLYLPRLGGLFFRNWTGGTGAGARGEDTGRNVVGTWTSGVHGTNHGQVGGMIYAINVYQPGVDTQEVPGISFGIDASRVWGTAHTAAEFAPVHVLQPIAFYLGAHT